MAVNWAELKADERVHLAQLISIQAAQETAASILSEQLRKVGI